MRLLGWLDLWVCGQQLISSFGGRLIAKGAVLCGADDAFSILGIAYDALRRHTRFDVPHVVEDEKLSADLSNIDAKELLKRNI